MAIAALAVLSDAKLAVDLQQGLCYVAPVEIIRLSSRAAYGLSEEEMSWNLKFLHDMA